MRNPVIVDPISFIQKFLDKQEKTRIYIYKELQILHDIDIDNSYKEQYLNTMFTELYFKCANNTVRTKCLKCKYSEECDKYRSEALRTLEIPQFNPYEM